MQVALYIDLDDLDTYDSTLVESIKSNTRRYVNILSDLVYEMLPDFKEREVRLNYVL